jgi:hypothetical protein
MPGTEASVHDAPHADAPPPVTKRVFVTSGLFTGDLAGEGAASDGIAGADSLCSAAAKTAGLTGTWLAWVSTSTTDAASRIDVTAIRVQLDGRKVLKPSVPNGLVAVAPLTMDEKGHSLPTAGYGNFEVWTATDALGHYETGKPITGSSTDNACAAWTQGSSKLSAVEGSLGAVVSSIVPSSNWTDGAPTGFDTCDATEHLYCFEK